VRLCFGGMRDRARFSLAGGGAISPLQGSETLCPPTQGGALG
jgi:hypothetical protein